MIELRSLGKRFGGVRALHEVSLRIAAGECHALVGENGAGKSTLGRVLAGVHAPDEGELFVDGRRVRFRSPADALRQGLALVPQEPAVCPDLSVAENMALGRWPLRAGLASGAGVAGVVGRLGLPGRLGVIARPALVARARSELALLGADLDPRAPVRALTVVQRQMLQIAAALGRGARLLILDEPTAALPETEVERLRDLLLALRTRGVAIVFIGHRLAEVLALADRVSVLRDGRLVATLARGEADAQRLVQLMLGENNRPPGALPAPSALLAAAVRVSPQGRAGSLDGGGVLGSGAPAVRLRVAGLASPGRFSDISLEVRAGEIVGLAGLLGAGRSELLAALFGLDPAAQGRVSVDGRALQLGSPRAALRAGLVLLPEDRQRQGLVMGLGARVNWSLPFVERFRWRWAGALIDRRSERSAARAALAAADLRAASLDTALEAPVAQLSGGNQQKVLLSRCLAAGAGVLLIDEPTRGVDVGAKAAIAEQLRAAAAAGAALLVASSDLAELLALSDRVLVLRAGQIAAERQKGVPAEEVLRLMSGVPSAA
ncbi:MAG: sugar ABC transporter ATP-binding protein [Planctomycetota bacterium]